MSDAGTAETIHLGKTISYGRRGNFVLFVSAPGKVPADEEWGTYVESLKAWCEQHDTLQVLVVSRDSAPTASQRSLFNREVPSQKLRIAAILESKKLLPIAKVFAWFVSSIEVFGADDLHKALHYLGNPRPSDVQWLLAELGIERSIAQPGSR